MKPAVAVLAATAVLVVASVVQAGNDFVIVAGGPRNDHRIGAYSFVRHPEYAGALAAFGKPTSRGADEQAGTCTVRWTRLALDMRFASSGSDVPCSGAALAQSLWAGATVFAGPWRTDKGLQIGDSVAALHRLYPNALYIDRPPDPPSWLLVYRRGEVGLTVYLQVSVWSGRVTAIDVPPGNVSVGH